MLNLLLEAAKVAVNNGDQTRSFCLGAIAIRRDQAVVRSHNGSAYVPYGPAHAERRCLAKAGRGAELYVARVARRDAKLALARPCNGCWLFMRRHCVTRCYYTISENEYGIITFGGNGSDAFTERVKKIT